MWLNNLILSFRSLRRRPVFSSINVLGLTVGMACCVLIGLYVQNELSYDTFHADSDRTYRIVQHDEADNRGIGWTGDGMRDVLRGVPEIESVALLTQNYSSDVTLGTEGASGERKVFRESSIYFASPEVLTTFGFPLTQGDAETALSEPGSVVLTETLAEKYFGDANPVGEAMRFGGSTDLTVTGVIADPPPNTHVQFNALVSRSTFYTAQGRPASFESSSFWWPKTWFFVTLQPGADVAAVQRQIEETTNTRRGEAIAAELDMVLQPLEAIHLGSSTIQGNLSEVGSMTRVWTFVTIALFILLIAGVNFMNLSTARAEERAREVGVRKTVGAGRPQLIRQFLGESLLLSFGSILAAVLLATGVLPAFTELMGVNLAYGIIDNAPLLVVAAAIALVTGIGAGSYPAFVLSRYLPANVLRGTYGGDSKSGIRLRQGLVVFQFAVSVILIVATVVAFQQLRFMQTADLGFDAEQVVALEVEDNYDTLKEELQRTPMVREVSGASVRPGIGYASNTLNYELEGVAPPEDRDNLAYQLVDFGYFEMMDVDVIAGRTFDADRRSDLGTVYGQDETHAGRWWRGRAMIINRATAERLDLTPEEAIGKDLRVYQQENGQLYNDVGGTVVGVVDDFHTGSLRNQIPPTVFVPSFVPLDVESQEATYWSDYLLAKVAPGNAATVKDELRSVWNEISPDAPFEAEFLNASIERMYQREARIGRVIGIFSGLAILVACLGLFGLATYTAQQRRKEIGIRKSLGATASSIVRLLSTDFMKLVAIAIVVGSPLAYGIMNQWLEDFPYRIDLGLGTLLLAGGVAFTIALLTVSVQSFRAASVNPADTLRSE